MTEFQANAVVDAINRMFASRYFNICVVDQCMQVTGAARTTDYESLRLYHCCDYAGMSRSTKDWLFRATLENISNIDDFPAVRLINKSEEIQQRVLLEEKKAPLLKRLFGI